MCQNGLRHLFDLDLGAGPGLAWSPDDSRLELDFNRRTTPASGQVLTTAYAADLRADQITAPLLMQGAENTSIANMELR